MGQRFSIIEESLYFRQALQFIEDIGINVRFGEVPAHSLIAGICIKDGAVVIDLQHLIQLGDVLHEAGHIAVVPFRDRTSLCNKSIAERGDAAAEEMMAIAWSYAACLYLKLPVEFVFHSNGYGGGGAHLASNFESGNFLGVPMLQHRGLCARLADGGPFYPAMKKWTAA
jgi:hypothetical protein